MSLYLEHYSKALEILSDPDFLDKELALAYYKPGQELYWGIIDDLVAKLTGQVTWGACAFIVGEDKVYRGLPVVKFHEVKDLILDALQVKLIAARAAEIEFLSKRKEKEEVKIPLVFEGKEFLLVKYSDNYADEFDAEGFQVFTKEDWKEWKSKIRFKNIRVNFGTNESNEYGTDSEFLDCLEVKEITAEQAKVLFDLFGHQTTRCFDWNGRYHNKTVEYTTIDYGMFPSSAGEYEEDDEEEYDEDESEKDDE